MTGSTTHLAVGLHRRDFAAFSFGLTPLGICPDCCAAARRRAGRDRARPPPLLSMDKLSVVLVAVFAGLPLAWRDG